MKLFIESIEINNTGSFAECWAPVNLIMDYKNQIVTITYHGYKNLECFQAGKNMIKNAGQTFKIKNWTSTTLNEEGEEVTVEHNDFNTFVVDGLDAAVDEALIRHIQTVDLDETFKNAEVV